MNNRNHLTQINVQVNININQAPTNTNNEPQGQEKQTRLHTALKFIKYVGAMVLPPLIEKLISLIFG